jgi:hypothetical protein
MPSIRAAAVTVIAKISPAKADGIASRAVSVARAVKVVVQKAAIAARSRRPLKLLSQQQLRRRSVRHPSAAPKRHVRAAKTTSRRIIRIFQPSCCARSEHAHR